MTENEISKVVMEATIELHRTLGGPVLLERCAGLLPHQGGRTVALAGLKLRSLVPELATMPPS